MDVVKSLVMSAPQAVPIEDHDDASALEYAILSNADHTIVKYLMHVTQKQFRDSSSSNLVSRNVQAPPFKDHAGCITILSNGCTVLGTRRCSNVS
jgi:hypothetical protein